MTSGVKEAYAYDGAGRRTSETRDPKGLNLATLFTYDSEGRLMRLTRPDGKHSDGNTIRTLVCEDESLIGRWDNKFDSVGRMDGTKHFPDSNSSLILSNAMRDGFKRPKPSAPKKRPPEEQVRRFCFHHRHPPMFRELKMGN